MSPRPLNIAFHNLCEKSWIAGCNYLQNLFQALRSLDTPPKIYLLNLSPPSDDSYKMLLPLVDEVLQFPVKRPMIDRFRYSVQMRTKVSLGAMNPVEYGLRQAGIDVVFTGKGFGDDFKFPSMLWIADLQHRHLPHMFTEEDRKKRDGQYMTWMKPANRVVASSQNAREDIATFAPENAEKLRVLNFVAQVSQHIYDVDPSPIAKHYNLPKKFFYLPNQFWQHKNHRVVIEALALLRMSHPHISVVCSGNTYDYRQPQFFNELLTMIAEKGVHEQFRVLGMIPFAHILPLCRQSVAILQPSLFEGWSTTVEEAKSLGKRLILSDIPVHREQNPPEARYFNPQNPEELAKCLVEFDEQYMSGSDGILEGNAKSAIHDRMREFGSQFMSIAQECL